MRNAFLERERMKKISERMKKISDEYAEINIWADNPGPPPYWGSTEEDGSENGRKVTFAHESEL